MVADSGNNTVDMVAVAVAATELQNGNEQSMAVASQLEKTNNTINGMNNENRKSIDLNAEPDNIVHCNSNGNGNFINQLSLSSSTTIDDGNNKTFLSEDQSKKMVTEKPMKSINEISSEKQQRIIQIRLLVRRREAGALIGKKGFNIKRLRETFSNSNFSIPDTGNGPERIVCISSDSKTIILILNDIAKLFLEKSGAKDEQIELKMLIHSWFAGLLIGMGGQSIKKLRNDSKAAIKIFEMCCPFSNERVCAIKAKPEIVVQTLCHIQKLIQDNPHKGTIKSYDALNFDINLADKYGGFLPEDFPSLTNQQNKASFLQCPSNKNNLRLGFVDSTTLKQNNINPSIPQLNSLLAALYQHQINCNQQQQQQHQQQRIRPMKRYSVWRAPTNTKTRQINDIGRHPMTSTSGQAANSSPTNLSSQAPSDLIKRTNSSNNRYHPYQQQQQQQQMTLNNDSRASISINGISRSNDDGNNINDNNNNNNVNGSRLENNSVNGHRDVHWNIQRMANLQQLQTTMQTIQPRALIPTPIITIANQNQLLSNFCHQTMQQNCQPTTSTSQMCQHMKDHNNNNNSMPCLCNFYMSLGTPQIRPAIIATKRALQSPARDTTNTPTTMIVNNNNNLNQTAVADSYANYIVQTTSNNSFIDNNHHQH